MTVGSRHGIVSVCRRGLARFRVRRGREPAFAGETHANGEGGGGTDSASPYATPITNLDGMTLAQYIQKHREADPRTATVV